MIPPPKETTVKQFNEIIRHEVHEKPRWELNRNIEWGQITAENKLYLELMFQRLWR